MIEQVYNQYYNTAGNYHWTGVHSGEHILQKGEKMSRYIDADAIEYHEIYDGQEFVRVAYGDDIDNTPTADVVEVVRCEHCMYQRKLFHADARRKDGGYYIYWCDLDDGYSHVCLDDDYCSKGEKREDG